MTASNEWASNNHHHIQSIPYNFNPQKADKRESRCARARPIKTLRCKFRIHEPSHTSTRRSYISPSPQQNQNRNNNGKKRHENPIGPSQEIRSSRNRASSGALLSRSLARRLIPVISASKQLPSRTILLLDG